jgi:hypothetical protein
MGIAMDTQKSANELLVYKLSGDQMYKDTVHVHSEERGGMKNGDIVRVTVTKDDGSRHSGFFAIRGRPGKGRIGIDFLGSQESLFLVMKPSERSAYFACPVDRR